MLEPAPEFSKVIQTHLRRTEWGDFPDVIIESHGGKVIGATTLTGKAYSAKLKLAFETLQALREKHGNGLEEWWIAAFGYGFERLTESEARYLARADDAHAISTRIVAAGRDRN